MQPFHRIKHVVFITNIVVFLLLSYYYTYGTIPPVPIRLHSKGNIVLGHVTETSGGVVAKFHGIITSVPDGGEWAVSHQGRLITEERRRNTQPIGGWVGPRHSMNTLGKRKIACCCWKTGPASSLVILLTALHLHRVVLNYAQGQKVHCHVHNTRNWVLSRDLNPVHVLEPHFHSIHCHSNGFTTFFHVCRCIYT